MRKRTLVATGLIIVSLLVLVACHQSTKGRVEIPHMGFSMKLPAGWQLDPNERGIFCDPAKRDSNVGWVAEYLLEGRSLNEFVDDSLKDWRKIEFLRRRIEKIAGRMKPGQRQASEKRTKPRILTKTSMKISALEAMEVVYENEYRVIEVFIRKGDKVINLMLRTSREDFPKHEASLREAIKSITIQ